MDKLYSNILLVLWISVMLISLVSARASCVRCESSNNEDCGEVLNDEQVRSQTRECDDINEDICMKTKVNALRTSWTSKNGELEIATTKISRFCGKSFNYPWLGCSYDTGKAGESWTCACKGDACNGAPATGRASLTGALLSAVLLVVRWFV